MIDSNYDVIVVGSGAGGAMAAYTLTRAGKKVLLLEAGRDYDPVTETPMFQAPRDAPLVGAPTPDKNFGFYDATVDGGWSVPGEPYTTGKGTEFKWWRSRMLGGRTNHWGRHSLRFSEHDFKGYSRDGLGADWPFEYSDIAPWYDKTEELVGICGTNTGLDDMPDSAPGVLQPPPTPRVPELLLAAAANKLGIPAAPMHRAILTRPKDERHACFYATECGRGCSIGAAFQTTTSLIPLAKATGNLHIITDAMVRSIDVDDKGRVNAVGYIDRKTAGHVNLPARAVVLAASACESARILLNSKSTHFPNGMANSSGQVGRNLMDSTGANIGADVPALKGRPVYNEDGHMSCHLFIPWWGHEAQARGELDFARGYHYELVTGFKEPGTYFPSKLQGYGAELKRQAKHDYGARVGLTLRGEMLPSEHCYMDIDNTVKDKWGIPVARFHWKWSDQELNQVAHGLKTGKAILTTMGATVGDLPAPEEAIKAGGEIIHEVGTTRMGASPKDSVTNQYGQTWDCDNLFIMDGGVFASNPHKNCTLTIMTLAMRNASWLASQLDKGGDLMEESFHIHRRIAVREVPIEPKLTRRQSLQWLGVIAAGLSLPLVSGCEPMMISAAKLAGNWPDLQLEPITGEGYGTDPDLTTPPESPWPLTMTASQRELAAVVADILIPRDGQYPSASEVGVIDIFDEWVSAPYPSYQSDRVEILSALVWLDEEAMRRFDRNFVQAGSPQQLAIINDIAYEEAESQLRYAYISRVFDAIRTLLTIAYFSSPEGTREIGYQGNVPIAGDYPGPSTEAMAHLDEMLHDLGLAEYAYKDLNEEP